MAQTTLLLAIQTSDSIANDTFYREALVRRLRPFTGDLVGFTPEELNVIDALLGNHLDGPTDEWTAHAESAWKKIHPNHDADADEQRATDILTALQDSGHLTIISVPTK